MFSMLGPRNADVKFERAIVKLIDDDVEHLVTAHNGNWLSGSPPAFIDFFPLGPIALISIEWFEFPADAEYERRSPSGTGRVPPARMAQDIDTAEAVITKLGKYPLERTTRGLRIIGHIRRQESN